jgi:glyoxylase-like metal-dependent hydrolase (beta-lactamase superfamily II)
MGSEREGTTHRASSSQGSGRFGEARLRAALLCVDNGARRRNVPRVTGLELLPIGVGDAFSTKHYSTCLALRSGDRWLLVDCPHPIRKMLREAATTAGVQLDLDRLEGVAVTHLHADHASGLEGFGQYCRFVLGRLARVAAHPLVLRRLWEGHLAAGMEWVRGADGALVPSRVEDYFDLVALDDGRAVEIAPFSIECRRTRHVVPTTAFRIDAGGRRIGISADTEFDPQLVDWLSSADLVIHETGPGIHTPLEALEALPAALRRKMRLVHFHDRDALAGAKIEPLEQGRLYQV